MGRELIPIDLACAIFKCSRRTVYNRIAQGKYAAHKASSVTYLEFAQVAAEYGKLVTAEMMRNWEFNEEANTYIPKTKTETDT